MLIIQVLVNNRTIDHLMIQNVSEKDTPIQNYKLRYPYGHEDQIFKHKRSSGYRPLLKQVIDYMIEHDKKHGCELFSQL